jgi:hypothetical protein
MLTADLQQVPIAMACIALHLMQQQQLCCHMPTDTPATLSTVSGANGYGPYGAPGGAAAAPPQATASIKLKDCPTPELLQHLPRMQRLMGRLLMCVPEGAAAIHPIILVSSTVVYAMFCFIMPCVCISAPPPPLSLYLLLLVSHRHQQLHIPCSVVCSFKQCCCCCLLLLLLQTSCSWVLKESRAVYKAASEGVMNLADKFFEMERAQALQVGSELQFTMLLLSRGARVDDLGCDVYIQWCLVSG